ncbi:transketolase [Tamaricihabitans halophyticus]|uniref:Transketolase n=1 Tax=Tamaricihabitans halophyticus TaxID=1262583 RepID=A0A4R2Q4F1_9PSEU|nr:transketolase [Tamaricihabitans halophyticus]TCP42638.1 transketolase [Tamaricihabitans halophyticus]
MAQQLRVDAIRAARSAGSGHPTSAMSAADLLAGLFDGHLRLDFDRPRAPHNDHFVLSKGHASPLLYAGYKAVGVINDEELMTFRSFGSRIEGHPTPLLPWVDVATGSLGQGLPIGVGLALAAKRLDRSTARVWVLCGDSEMTEGSVWEAFEHAAHERLDNLVALVDVNRLGQTGETMHGWGLSAYAARAQAFGWQALEIDGHDAGQIERALTRAGQASDRPVVILARTCKGKGVAEVEDQHGKHGKPLAEPDKAIDQLGGSRNLRFTPARPGAETGHQPARRTPVSLTRHEIGTETATRHAYGSALRELGTLRADVVALDGEVSNSTFAELFRDSHPDRYFEMYIAEQQLVASAVGMQARGWRPFASTFAAFLTRAYDFVRMAAISRANIRLMGSHAGVATGEDGPSQMGLEDIAAFRAIHGSTVLCPSDANQTAVLVEQLADSSGVCYLRTSRGSVPVLYDPAQEFPIGGSTVLRDGTDVTLVGAGVTLHEALSAAENLASEGLRARVIDLYSIKPVDTETIARAAVETGAIVTVEDHHPEGGVGDAVLEALASADTPVPVTKLAVRTMPGSGKAAELMRQARIDAHAIAEAAGQLVASKPG